MLMTLFQKKINNKYLFNSFKYLKNKKLEDVLSAQFIATQNVLIKIFHLEHLL